MRNPAAYSRQAAIVLGCSDVGSAVALALFGAGYSVALLDEADPAWHRRGMAFTNAWYTGNAELEGEGACFCASLKSIPSVLTRRMIAATTWSWPGVAGMLAPTVLIDARGRKRRGREVLLGQVPLTIGIGDDFVTGENVDMVLELPCDSAERRRAQSKLMDAGPRADDDPIPASHCIVDAACHGRFMTERRIGDAVRSGQIVGGLGNEVILAPGTGVLLGLAARGARIEPGDRLVEIDPTGISHRCFGVGAGPRRVASDVLLAVEGNRTSARHQIVTPAHQTAGFFTQRGSR